MVLVSLTRPSFSLCHKKSNKAVLIHVPSLSAEGPVLFLNHLQPGVTQNEFFGSQSRLDHSFDMSASNV